MKVNVSSPELVKGEPSVPLGPPPRPPLFRQRWVLTFDLRPLTGQPAGLKTEPDEDLSSGAGNAGARARERMEETHAFLRSECVSVCVCGSPSSLGTAPNDAQRLLSASAG